MLFDNEEDVFWIFVQIIENILPCEYYSELVGIMSDCSLSLKILKETNKKIMKKISGFEVVLNNLLYKWFISLFVENTSMDTFLCIWDALFLDGNIVLLRAVNSILELMEDDIMRCDNMESLTMLFEDKVCKLIFNREKFMKLLLNEGKLKLEPKAIENMREELNKEVIHTIIKTKKNDKKTKAQVDINGVEIECDYDYPYCLKEFDDEAIKKKKKRYFPVFSTPNPNEPLSKEEQEKYKKLLEQEAISEFELQNIQVVQTFRTNNPIIFIPNYFQQNSNTNEGIILDDNIIGINNTENLGLGQKNANEKLIQNVKTYQNLLVHRAEHLCKTKKQTSEIILSQEDLTKSDEINKSIFMKTNLTQSFLSNFNKDVNKNEINDMLGSIQKNFSINTEIELLSTDKNNNNNV